MRFPQAELGFQNTLETIYPVGCIYVSVVSANPAALFGFGTWVAFGAGRCMVGVDAGDSDFDAAEKTSGAKTVTLTEAQMPAHTHVQNAHNHLQDPHSHTQAVNSATTGGNSGYTPDTTTNTPVNSAYATAQTTATCQAATAVNQNTGGGQAHANVQPSIAVYFFKRTA